MHNFPSPFWLAHCPLLAGATDVDKVRARQAAAEEKLQELEPQQQNLEQQLQQLPVAEPAWMVVQQRIASLQQQIASLQQRIAALQELELELVRQAGECNLVLPWTPGASETIGRVQLYACAKGCPAAGFAGADGACARWKQQGLPWLAIGQAVARVMCTKAA